MPSVLRRRSRRSLRLDQYSRQVLISKLNVKSSSSSEPAPSTTCTLDVRQNFARPCARAKSNLQDTNSSTSPQQCGPPSGALLPIELLLRIFIFGSEICDEFSVAVSQTCRLWRWIAVRSPTLWCHIKPDNRRLLCARRIHRSGGHPLDIEIAFTSSTPIFDCSALGYVHQLMASVLPVVKQWRSLSISIDGYIPFLWNSILSGLCMNPEPHSTYMKNLESLTLVYPMNDDTKEFHLFADNAPQLKNILLWGIRLRWTESLFSNLVSLDYTHHGFNTGHDAVQEMLSMLSVSCSKLRSLSIAFSQFTWNDYASSTGWLPHLYRKITLNEVRELVLRIDGPSLPNELTLLIKKLEFPSLVSLNLRSSSKTKLYSRKTVRSVIRHLRGHDKLERVIVGGGWKQLRLVRSIKPGVKLLEIG